MSRRRSKPTRADAMAIATASAMEGLGLLRDPQDAEAELDQRSISLDDFLRGAVRCGSVTTSFDVAQRAAVLLVHLAPRQHADLDDFLEMLKEDGLGGGLDYLIDWSGLPERGSLPATVRLGLRVAGLPRPLWIVFDGQDAERLWALCSDRAHLALAPSAAQGLTGIDGMTSCWDIGPVPAPEEVGALLSWLRIPRPEPHEVAVIDLGRPRRRPARSRRR